MAIRSSGQLSMRDDIARELQAGTTNLSLRNLSSRAGFGTPDAMSEFYGYSYSNFIFIGFQDPAGCIITEPSGRGGDGIRYQWTQRSIGDGNASFAVHQMTFSGGRTIRFGINDTSFDSSILIYQTANPSTFGNFRGFAGPSRNPNTISINTANGIYLRVALDIQRGRENTFYTRTLYMGVI